jgi:hypothetical protein
MDINRYLREKNNEDLFSNDDSGQANQNMRDALTKHEQRVFKILVCQPDTQNITTIFSTMEHIIKDISDEIRSIPSVTQSDHRPDMILDKFLQEFILTKFISNAVESIKENASIHSKTSSNDNNNSKGENPLIYDMSNQLISLPKQKELALNKPILESSLLVYQSCTDLYNLIRDMSSYASQFTLAMYSLIEKHTVHQNQLFLSIVSNVIPGESDSFSYVYSMIWVQDEGK